MSETDKGLLEALLHVYMQARVTAHKNERLATALRRASEAMILEGINPLLSAQGIRQYEYIRGRWIARALEYPESRPPIKRE